MSRIIYDNDDLVVYVSQGISVSRADLDKMIENISTFISTIIDQLDLNTVYIKDDKESVVNHIREFFDLPDSTISASIDYILSNEFEVSNLVQQVDSHMEGSILDQGKVVEELLESGIFDIEDNVLSEDYENYMI